MAAAAKAIRQFEEADGKELDEARALASQSLHHAWATVTDGGARPNSRLEPIVEELTELQARYEHRSAQFSGQLAGFDIRPWGATAGEETNDRSQLTGVDREQLRDSSLGRPDAPYLLRRSLTWPSGAVLQAIRVGLAVAIAGSIAVLTGGPHPYWAAAFAMLILHQGGSKHAQTVRGIQRLLGTVVGLGLYGLIVLWDPSGIWIAVLVGTLQFLIESFVVRNYAIAVTFITPLALTIANIAGGTDNPLPNVLERMFDSVLAVGVALAVLWTVGRGTALYFARANARRSIHAMEPVLDALVERRVNTPEAAVERRHLYFELLRLQHVADQSYRDEPFRVRPYLPTFNGVAQLGYSVLGACWHPESDAAAEAAGRVRESLTRITIHPVEEYRDPVSLHDDVAWATEQLRQWRA